MAEQDVVTILKVKNSTYEYWWSNLLFFNVWTNFEYMSTLLCCFTDCV